MRNGQITERQVVNGAGIAMAMTMNKVRVRRRRRAVNKGPGKTREHRM
jgi:hypothetical protein